MSLVAEIERWRARLAWIDAEVLSAGDCAVLVGALAVLGKACDAARARGAARAESCGAHAKAGFVDGGWGGCRGVPAPRAAWWRGRSGWRWRLGPLRSRRGGPWPRRGRCPAGRR